VGGVLSDQLDQTLWWMIWAKTAPSITFVWSAVWRQRANRVDRCTVIIANEHGVCSPLIWLFFLRVVSFYLQRRTFENNGRQCVYLRFVHDDRLSLISRTWHVAIFALYMYSHVQATVWRVSRKREHERGPTFSLLKCWNEVLVFFTFWIHYKSAELNSYKAKTSRTT